MSAVWLRSSMVLAIGICLTVGMAAAGHNTAANGTGKQAAVKPGMIGPGSPLYGLEVAMDNAAVSIGLANAGGLAQERAAEAKAAADKGNAKAAEKAAKEMSNIAKKAKSSDREGVQRAVSILKSVTEQAPQEAQSGLQNALRNVQGEDMPQDEERQLVPPSKGTKDENDTGRPPADKVTIDPEADRHIVGLTADGDVDAVKAKAESVRHVLDFGDIGKAVAGNFSVAALEELRNRDDVRYIEPDRKAGIPEQPDPSNFTCPDQDSVNCMPGGVERHAACYGDYHEWVKQNCDVGFAY